MVRTDENGRATIVGLYCRAWAMPNGRCRMHGGASTGPKSREGKARVVAAMVDGRRAWAERVRAKGGKLNSGRKTGAAWVTESMRERALAAARRLGATRFTLDRPLILALLRSANASPEGRARAKALLAASMREEIERECNRAKDVLREIIAQRTEARRG